MEGGLQPEMGRGEFSHHLRQLDQVARQQAGAQGVQQQRVGVQNLDDVFYCVDCGHIFATFLATAVYMPGERLSRRSRTPSPALTRRAALS